MIITFMYIYGVIKGVCEPDIFCLLICLLADALLIGIIEDIRK